MTRIFQRRENAFFHAKFDNGAWHSDNNNSIAVQLAASHDKVHELLATAIPYQSSAAGSSPIPLISAGRNYDMWDHPGSGQWPTSQDRGPGGGRGGQWFHGDIRDLPFSLSMPSWKKMIEVMNLKN